MDTTINKLNRDSNSIPSLNFYWTARFKDNSEICQFKDDGSENSFKLVKDKFEELKEFYLINENLLKFFRVDLINGIIYIDKNQEVSIDLLEKKDNIRLICFRRHRIEMTCNLIEKSHKILYFLGIQYNNKFGNNCKIILQIDKLGNFLIGA